MLSDVPTGTIRDVISRMVEAGFLVRTDGLYPTLAIDPSLNKFILSGRQMTLKLRKESPKKKPKKYSPEPSTKIDGALYEKLRKFRRDVADRRGVPAYVIFTDMTLRDLAVKKPTNMTELLEVRGIGSEKAEKYGTAILGIIKGLL